MQFAVFSPNLEREHGEHPAPFPTEAEKVHVLFGCLVHSHWVHRLAVVLAVVRKHYDCLHICDGGALYVLRRRINMDLWSYHPRGYVCFRELLVVPLHHVGRERDSEEWPCVDGDQRRPSPPAFS